MWSGMTKMAPSPSGRIQESRILEIILVILMLKAANSLSLGHNKILKLDKDSKYEVKIKPQIFTEFKFKEKTVEQLYLMRELVEKFQPVEYGESTNGFKRTASEKVECLVCKGVTFTLQQTLLHNEDHFAELVDTICKDFHIEEADICDGIIQIFKKEVLTVLDKLWLDPDELCGLILGPSCAQYYDPYNMWNITLPEQPAQSESAHSAHSHKPHYQNHQGKGRSLRVLHLSDIHVDLKYQVGSNADCDRPLCCRNTSGPTKSPAGQWGSYSKCDLPLPTLINLFQHLSTNDKFDYILWTGDLTSHADWDQSRERTLQLVDTVSDLFKKYLPDTPVYWSLGNHEGIPVNSFPPPYIGGEDSMSWLYTHLVNVWAEWLPPSTVQNITRGGFYTVELQPGYRLVSLNMNYCNNQNWWMLINTTDPAAELQWFVSVLYQAELAGEKIHVIGHIPPGSSACLQAWSWNYYRIVNRFSSTITGQFFGHTHTDSLEIFYDLPTLTRPVAVAYVGPSVTTFIAMNPAYRVYTVDGFYQNTTWSVVDHETYILNLTEANTQQDLQWKLEYTAKSAYNMSDLSAGAWHKFSKKLLHDNSTLLQYIRHYYKSSPGYTNCDEKCRKSHVCDIRTARSHDPSLCRDLDLDDTHFQKWQMENTMC